MRTGRSTPIRSSRASRLLAATALAILFGAPLSALPIQAQQLDLGSSTPASDAEMLLEADTLIYDNDRNTITASGGVQIDYDGNRLVADEVVYDRNTARLMARGGVEIVDGDGTVIQSDEIDVTDDFRDGFVDTLRVETVDRTHFAADSAERSDGAVTTFDRGVYTACEPCRANPDRAPLWQIRAQKIIWNGEAQTIRFERSRFELLGIPLMFLPVFEIPDHTVERASGLLPPAFRGSSELGSGIEIPYYLALHPTYDLTLHATGFTKQGFLGQAEWRQRFNNGEYSIRIAGIHQRKPEEFNPGWVDRDVTNRGMIGTKGRFDINPRWTFGWDVLAQSDKNFSHTYSIPGYSELIHRSEIYLTGLNDRNYFDARAMRFHVQEELQDRHSNARNDFQPWVTPSLDYVRFADRPIAGGQLRFDINAQGIHRSRLHEVGPFDGTIPNQTRILGPEGTSARLTAEAEWKRTVITPGGVSLTPLLHGRGDVIGNDFSQSSIDAIENFAINNGIASDVRSAYYRAMATAGLEARWPILFSTTSATHILEPVGQIFASPNEPYGNSVGIPNEDAQSMVFDASNLFERDRFAGYDRMEGGVRANVGLRYSGSFANGWSTSAIFGQSFHLAGRNSFASPDLVHAGAFSGLDARRSDYVGQIGVTSPTGIGLTAGARFDERTFETRRADIAASYSTEPIALRASYSYIQAQPDYGFEDDRHELRLGASARVHENWRVFGSGIYNFEENFITRRQVGIHYSCECVDLRVFVQETQPRRSDEVHRSFGFALELRTLGEFGTNTETW